MRVERDMRVTRERAVSMIAVAAIHVAVGWVLLTGLGGALVRQVPETLALFDVVPPAPPPPEPTTRPHPVRSPEEEGAAAPPALRATATPVVAPPPAIPVVSPLPAAPVPDIGFEVRQGAAPVPGPGTGAGGEGDGTGSGRFGNGRGGGGAETPPRWRRGSMSLRDYPRALYEAGIGGTVEVSFVVGIDGRVRDCRIERSSGTRLLDTTTCRLIEQRFRYAPSRDAAGRPVEAVIVENHSWEVEVVPPEEGDGY